MEILDCMNPEEIRTATLEDEHSVHWQSSYFVVGHQQKLRCKTTYNLNLTGHSLLRWQS